MKSENLQQIIWQIVASVPAGQVVTYGQVARLAGYPSHARLVGATMKALPSDSRLPWHRVINAQGKISFPFGSEAFLRQKKRLEAEGVSFKNGKIALKTYQWDS